MRYTIEIVLSSHGRMSRVKTLKPRSKQEDWPRIQAGTRSNLRFVGRPVPDPAVKSPFHDRHTVTVNVI